MNRALGFAMVMGMVGAAFVWACSSSSEETGEVADAAPAETAPPSTSSGSSGASSGTSGTPAKTLKAKALIKPTSDASTVEGTAEFTEQGAALVVKVTIASSGGPAGEHGLHIHENGNCDPVDGGAGLGAGGHWNPADAGHAYPSAGSHHLGDLGNIVIDDAGAGTTQLTFPSSGIYVHDGANTVVGHAVVFHAMRDDGVTQPVGNAGARPGCGVIAKE